MNLNKKLLGFTVLGKFVLAACCLLLSLQNAAAQKYEGTPATKQGIIKALTSKQFQTREIVQRVNARGVDFQLTPSVQAELVAAGGRPEIIEAVRNNYRASATTKPTTGKPTTNTGKKFTGNPLDKDAIVTLLENGVADAQVRKNIEARGVTFKSTSAIKSEIKAAGGSVALLNLIALSYVDPNQSSASNNTVATNSGAGGNDYDSLIDKAVDQYDNKKDKTARSLLCSKPFR